MRAFQRLHGLGTLVLALVLAGCGGTDPELADSPPQATQLHAAPAGLSAVHLQSDPGDEVGQGRAYAYTSANANIQVQVARGTLSVQVAGREAWSGEFALSEPHDKLQPGYHGKTVRLDWAQAERRCSVAQGWVNIDQAVYDGDQLTALDLRFEQRCEGQSAALRGEVHWTAATALPALKVQAAGKVAGLAAAGPITPLPEGLWKPAPDSTPDEGNFVYLASDPGDYIGAGRESLYTQTTATLAVRTNGAYLSMRVSGDDDWSGDFQAMNTLSELQPGYYGDLQRYPFHNPVQGGLSWSGEGRGCNTLTGWFVVDSVRYVAGQLADIDLRFEQHCEGNTPALRGRIRWSAEDTSTPPGPLLPPPQDLWQPAPGTVPASGNFVYLQSEAGDYIGRGVTRTYTPADTSFTVSGRGGLLGVSLRGDQSWSGNFQTMNTLTRLQPGYYADLQRYPFHNPVKGGLDWSGDGRGCNTLRGWFVVDQVVYTGDVLQAIDLRFEQHCEGSAPALRGRIRWSANEPSTPPGPVAPPPGLWQPTPGAVPTSGNFVYLQSDAGDYIGQGLTRTYTPATASFTGSSSGGRFNLLLSGAQSWSGAFQAMNTLTQLQPGYYGDLQRYPFHNPVKGGLSWSGNGRGCNTLRGWFVVDQVVYSAGVLRAIDLRFEQHCEGITPALRGQIHWAAGS